MQNHHRRSPQKSTKQNDSGELYTILQSVVERLDNMDKRFNALQTQQTPHTKITPLLNIDTRPPTVPTTGPSTSVAPIRSNNPDFGDMWKGLFRSVQLQHHLKNWEKIPTSIENKLKELGEFITPPSPNPETSTSINTIMLNAGELIRQCITAHIDTNIQNNRLHLKELNSTDINKAYLIAEKHLKRRLGSKLTEPFLKKTLDTELRHLTRDNPVIQTITQPNIPDRQYPNPLEWTTVSRKNSKRQQPENRTPSPTTSNNLAILTELDHDLEPSDQETENNLTTNHTPLIKRIRTATTPITRSINLRRFIVGDQNRHDLKSLPATTHTVVIADSNLRSIKDDQIPKNWHLSINPGLTIAQSLKMVRDRNTALRAQRIILAVGINDRDTDPNITKAHLADLAKVIIDKEEREGTAILFSQIAYNQRSLRSAITNTIDKINNSALELIDPLYLLKTLPPSEIDSKDDGVHHTDECAARVWNKLIEETNKFNTSYYNTKN